jgi:hypothetical protein
VIALGPEGLRVWDAATKERADGLAHGLVQNYRTQARQQNGWVGDCRVLMGQVVAEWGLMPTSVTPEGVNCDLVRVDRERGKSGVDNC